MKNNKFIATSIASMMLFAGMAMPKSLAAGSSEIRYAKNSGYLTSDSSAIVVGLTNGDKDLTQDELRQLINDKYGLTVQDLTDTGSKIRFTTGESATLVIYGDVEADGKIDLYDAQATFDHYRGNATLTDAKFRAADTVEETSGDDVIDLYDAQRLFDIYRGSHTGLVVDTPKLPEDVPTKIDTNVHIEPVDEYINNVNEGHFKVNIKLDKGLEEATTYTIEVLDKGGKELSPTTPFMSDSKVEFNASTATEISIETELNFSDSSLTDNTYTIVLKDKDGNIVATKTVQKVSDRDTTDPELLPAAVKIKTNRKDSHIGELSFQGHGGTEVTKIYYAVVDLTNSGSMDKTKLIDVANHEKNKVKTMTIIGNKLDLTEISNTLTEATAAKVMFVVLDKYGNVNASTEGTSGVYEAVITTGVEKDAEKTPKTVSMVATSTNGTAVTLTATITPDGTPTSTLYTVRLYDEQGNIVAEDTKVAVSTNQPVTTTFTVDKPGKYHVGALVQGKSDGTTKESEELISDKNIAVKQLSAPSAIAFAEKENDNTDRKGTLTWTGVSDDEAEVLKDYTVTFYKYVTEDKEFVKDTSFGSSGVVTVSSDSIENGKMKSDITTLNPNTVYRVKIVAEVDNTATKNTLNSEEIESESFFILHAKSLLDKESIGKNSITLKVNRNETTKEPSLVKKFNFEKAPTYDINIWVKSANDETNESKRNWKTIKNVPVVKSDDKYDYLVIDGLEADGVTYFFRLILNYEGKSDAAVKDPAEVAPDEVSMETNKLIPSLTDLTVVDSTALEGEPTAQTLKEDNTIYFKDNTEVYIKKNGKDYHITGLNNPTGYEDPDNLLKTLSNLKQSSVTAKDAVKVNDIIRAISADKVTVELKTEGTANGSGVSSTDFRDFGTIENKSLEIIGNGFQQGIVATVKGGDVLLKTEGADFDVSQVNVDSNHKIIAAKGVELYLLDEDVTQMPAVEVTEDATICGVKVAGSTEYSVTNTNEFTVGATSNKLTLETEAPLTVTVNQPRDKSNSIQSGDIEIIAKGNVTLTPSASISMTGNVAVTTTDGNVTLTSVPAEVSKKITLNYTDKVAHTVTVKSNKVPDAIGKITDISTTGVTLKTNLTKSDINGTMSDEEKLTAAEFLNSFGIEEDSNDPVTFKYNSADKTVTISWAAPVNTQNRSVKNLTINL